MLYVNNFLLLLVLTVFKSTHLANHLINATTPTEAQALNAVLCNKMGTADTISYNRMIAPSVPVGKSSLFIERQIRPQAGQILKKNFKALARPYSSGYCSKDISTTVWCISGIEFLPSISVKGTLQFTPNLRVNA